MYPTIIVVLVALQRSHLEYQFSYRDPRMRVEDPVMSEPFQAHVPTRSSSYDWTATIEADRRRMVIRELPLEDEGRDRDGDGSKSDLGVSGSSVAGADEKKMEV